MSETLPLTEVEARIPRPSVQVAEVKPGRLVEVYSAAGPSGNPGNPGRPGDPGAPGDTIITGTQPPMPGDGKDGDFYIEDRTASGQGRRMWGPKAGGAWPGTPWNIQVASYSDVPGLPRALAEKADLVATGMALGGKAAAGVNSDIAELRGLSAPIPEAGLPAGEKYGILRGLTGQASADASAPLQAFFDALRAQGGVGVLPVGTMALKTAAVAITGGAPFKLRGPGRDLSTVLRAGSFATPLSVTGASAVSFEDFTLDAGNDAFPTASNHAFNLADCTNIAFRRMRIRNWKNSAILLISSATPGTSGRILYEDVIFDGLGVANNGAFFGGADLCIMRAVQVKGCPGNPGYGLQLKGIAKYCVIENSIVEDCAGGAAFGQDTATPSVYMARVNGLHVLRCIGGLLAGYASYSQFSNILIDATGLATAVGIRWQNSQGITGKNITIKGIPAGANSYAVRLDDCTDCVIEVDLLDNVPNGPIVFTGSSARNTIYIRGISNSPTLTNLYTDTSTGVGTNQVIYLPAQKPMLLGVAALGNNATDATAAFAAAIARTPEGGEIEIPPGTYTINSLSLTKTVSFRALGSGAVLVHKAGATGSMFECAAGGKTYKFSGITFDGNRTAQVPAFTGRIIRMNKLGGVGNNATVVDVESCVFNNVAQFGVIFYGDLNDTTREQVYIRRCRFSGINEGGGDGSAYNPAFVALYDGIETAVVESNDFDMGYTPSGTGACAVHVSTTNNTARRTVRLALERNVIRGLGRLATNGLGAVDLYIWGENVSIINNRVYSPYAPGLRCKLSSENVVISHNQVYGVQNGHNGISLSNGTTGTNYGKIIVTDNIVDGAFNGIVVQGSNTSQAQETICSRNIVKNTADAPIYLENVYNAQANSNEVRNSGSYGILVSKWGGSLSLKDNIIDTTASWGAYVTRLSVSNGPLLSLSGNQIIAATNIGINVAGAGRVTANGNQFDSIGGTNTLIKLDSIATSYVVQGNSGSGTLNLQVTNSGSAVAKESGNTWNP